MLKGKGTFLLNLKLSSLEKRIKEKIIILINNFVLITVNVPLKLSYPFSLFSSKKIFD